MHPTVRIATVDDAAAIARAHVDAWKVAYEGIVPASHLDALDVDERTKEWTSILRGEVEVPAVARPTNHVVEVDGLVVGFACVGDYREDNQPEHGELWALYVHPDQWGTGCGAALMRTTLRQFADERRRTGHLWVLQHNTTAQGFYEGWGWRHDPDTEPHRFDIDGAPNAEIPYRIDL